MLKLSEFNVITKEQNDHFYKFTVKKPKFDKDMSFEKSEVWIDQRIKY